MSGYSPEFITTARRIARAFELINIADVASALGAPAAAPGQYPHSAEFGAPAPAGGLSRDASVTQPGEDDILTVEPNAEQILAEIKEKAEKAKSKSSVAGAPSPAAAPGPFGLDNSAWTTLVLNLATQLLPQVPRIQVLQPFSAGLSSPDSSVPHSDIAFVYLSRGILAGSALISFRQSRIRGSLCFP